MQTAIRHKAAPTKTHSTLAKAHQPALGAPTLAWSQTSILDTQPEENTRANHNFGAFGIFPLGSRVQPKRETDLTNRLPAFNSPVQHKVNPFPKLPSSCVVHPPIQAKLTVGQPNEKCEKEADHVADRVVQRPTKPDAGLQMKCAACEAEDDRGRVQKKSNIREDVKNSEEIASSDIESQLVRSKGGGSPLPGRTRASMESALGADFSTVRVHTDTKAVQMSQDLNALAFTHGSDLYFNSGQYQTSAVEGERLLAHELVHTVQQGGVGLTSGVVQRSCGSAAIGSPAGCEELVGDVSGPRYLFKTNCDLFARGNNLDLEKDAEKIGDNATVEIHGLASVDGDAQYNERLSCARAITAKKLVEGVLSNRKVTATIRLFSHGAQKGDKTTMRSVVMTVQNPAPVPAPRTALACPPVKGYQASTLEDYIDLIKCVETSTTLGNRGVLALLRQMYYGKSWSATSQTDFWDNVITCNENPGDPRKLLHMDLFGALHRSVVVQSTDVGHVFTGLESMMCPSSEVDVDTTPIVSDIMDDIANVKMSNEQFSTWGGDLGAAVAAMAACWFMDETQRSSTEDCKGADLMQGLLAFLKLHAPDEDLEGDILPFVIRANANGISCSGSMGQKLNLSAPISQLFVNFMQSKAASGNANRYVCFTEIIGGQITGGQIQNKDALVKTYFDPVFEFAKTFYVKIMVDVHGKIPPHRVVPFGNTILMMQRHTPMAIRYFLAWLEKGMASAP